MGATKARRGLFSLGMLWLWSLVIVDNVLAQGEVSFIARRGFAVGGGAQSVTVGDLDGVDTGAVQSAHDAGDALEGDPVPQRVHAVTQRHVLEEDPGHADTARAACPAIPPRGMGTAWWPAARSIFAAFAGCPARCVLPGWSGLTMR